MGKPTSNRVLYFFVAVGALVPIVLAVSVWYFLRTDIGGVVSSMGSAVLRRMGAPGVAELRGIGCDQALVLTVGDIFETSLLSDDEREKLARSAERPILTCGDFFGRRPTCGEVAATYAPFAPGQDRSIVRVTSRGEVVCDGVYAASGEFIAPRTREMLLGELEATEEGVGEESP